MSMSSDLDITGARRLVAAAGTRVVLVGGIPSLMRTRTLCIKALTTNAGKIYVGNSTVSNTVNFVDLDPGDVLTLTISRDDWEKGFEAINMGLIYLDADNNGEGVNYGYRRE